MVELTYKRGRWILRKKYCREGICVPRGFKTDLASIPRLFWSFYPPFGDYMNAAVIHDFLYKKLFPKKQADLIFYRIMKEDGVGALTRIIFYYAVKYFGGKDYRPKV